MPFTVNLGCGTWGGNIASENITWKHYINTTWVARPIQIEVPSDEELFGSVKNDSTLFGPDAETSLIPRAGGVSW